jgi:GTPase SAR1 family protein
MLLIRLLIIGETGVGKTSLLIRFNENNFVADQKTTIGVDYKAKEVVIDGDNVKLQV